MNHGTSEPVTRAWIALMRAQQVALRRIERAFREAGLPSLTVYDALWELEKAGQAGLRPFELEERILVAQSNISRSIDRLVRDGYAQRRVCQEDGRGQVVSITRSGRALRGKMWSVYSPAIGAAVGQYLTDAGASELVRLLEPMGTEAR